jgi:hypothetical protein
MVSTLAATLTMFACTRFDTDEPGPDAGSDGAGVDAAGDALVDAGFATRGCADGTREALKNAAKVAGCEGAWLLPGLDTAPLCGRAAGNDGRFPDGTGCAAADLCASGWHVCVSAAEFKASGGFCETGTTDAGPTVPFFATAQRSNGGEICDDDGGNNDIFGCFVGSPDANKYCGILNGLFGFAYGPTASGFNVGGDLNNERVNVVKGRGPGGVYCCSD